MPRRIAIALPLVFILVIVAAARAEFTSKEWQQLKNGEVIITEVLNPNADGSQRSDFLAKLYVKADRQTVWKYLRDYEKFPEFMPNVVVCKIIKRDGQVYWVHYEAKVMIVKAVYNLRVEGVELNKKIVFKLDKTQPSTIRDTAGYWILEDAPDGSGTVLSYSTYVDTGIPAPEALARQAAKKSLPQVVKNMRMRIESGGKWKKEPGT